VLTVVVASVEVPRTIRRPDVVALPFVSTLKLRFSTHALPFQYSVDDVAVPFVILPEIDVQYVEVQLVART
jgi:hypothetical protein